MQHDNSNKVTINNFKFNIQLLYKFLDKRIHNMCVLYLKIYLMYGIEFVKNQVEQITCKFDFKASISMNVATYQQKKVEQK